MDIMCINIGDDNYKKYRGKCKQYAEALCKEDSTLRLVRGFYHCPVWGTKEAHWWCAKPDGTIVDPTKDQFISKGNGTYEEFDGWIECDNCKAKFHERELNKNGRCLDGRYAFCSTRCHGIFIGAIDEDDECNA